MTYKERYPEFIQEIMEHDHGTKVLITDPSADKYLEQAIEQEKLKKLKQQYPHWDQD